MKSTMQVTVTDYLKFEYVKMPILDCSYRFLYRYKLPFETIWLEGKIGMIDRDNNRFGLDNIKSLLKEFAMKTWNEMCMNNMGSDEIPKEAEWLFNMKGVDLVECEIKPKVLDETGKS